MKRFLLILAGLLLCGSLFAIPVFRQRLTLTQPDGTQVQAVLSGDERAHQMTDLQGHLLVQDEGRWWRYADLQADGSRKATAWAAGRPAPAAVLRASIPPADFRPARIPQERPLRRPFAAGDGSGDPTGPAFPSERNCLIILVQFPDRTFRYESSEFERMVHEPGYADGGSVGCIDDYFAEQFRDDCRFSFEICGPVTLSQPSSDYFGNDEQGNDKAARDAVVEACTDASEQMGVDFSRFATDGVQVDNVFLMIAGKSEADGGDEDCVWPHMAYLSGSPKYRDFQLNGVSVNAYTITTELQRNLTDGTYGLTGIGTFCHEYSHSLGLMDLYDTDYAGSGGMASGMWRTTALMDGGNYNNDGRVPPHYNAVDYDCLGLGSPETLQVGSYVLEPVSRNRRFLRYETGTEGEYFLLECRSATGWDTAIGGAGLLIYHIDRSTRTTGYSDTQERNLTAWQRWQWNEVNCRPDHPCARLVAAVPGLRAYNSSLEFQFNQASVFFPGKEYTAFTALTTPAFVFWDGSESPLAITEIEMDGENVRFTVARMSDVVVPEVTGVDSFIFQDAAILQWEADNPDYAGTATVTWGQAGVAGKEVEVKPYAAGKYALTLEGLTPGKAYKAVITFRNSGISSKQAPVNFTTKYIYDGSMPFIYVNSLQRASDGTVAAGSKLPLRVYNVLKADSVEWEWNGTPVLPGGDGFFTLERSGTLRAIIHYRDGSTEYIVKEIKVL